MNNLSQLYLHDVLDYSSDTGEFRWKKHFRRGLIGKRPEFLNSKGYFAFHVRGRQYLASRLAWFYVYGKWPNDQIDHINGIRVDNRIANLREATRSQNIANRIAFGASSAKGVCFEKGKFIAKIMLNGRQRRLGSFETKEEAALAYQQASEEAHGPFSFSLSRGGAHV